LNTLKSTFNQIPKEVKLFLIKALLLLLVWKVLYDGFLMPSRVLDYPLTSITAVSTAAVMKVFYPGNSIKILPSIFPSIYINNRLALVIKDGCNALELYVLFIGFIVCIPGNLKKMLLFIAGGIAGIYILNIIRCCILTYLNFIQFNYHLVNIAHHYIFTLVVYASIFMVWVKYIGSTSTALKNNESISKGN
jgi:exosortase family protein XrtF